LDIIGGFHLLKARKGVLTKVIRYFQSQQIKNLHPRHCTDLKAKIELGKYFSVEEVGSGLVLKYEE
jgi:7,8-dihydropterin-6-yl-methyl-4-(beta-D-ribofuranosyl)aminobenzene 5'-phosphate synthase